MNLILYGSLAMVAFSKPWRAPACNFLDVRLGFTGADRWAAVERAKTVAKKAGQMADCSGMLLTCREQRCKRRKLLHAFEGLS